MGVAGVTKGRMKRLPILLVLIVFVLAGCRTAGRSTPKALFNGRDLDGWAVMHGGEWTVEEGVLVGRNGVNWSTDPETSGSWLRARREYGNFILDLEYTIQGNSGIFLRSGLEKNPAFTGYEMQILADHGGPPAIWSAGGLYDVVAPGKNMSKPAGEWNHVRIIAQGPRIQVALNGEMIVDYTEATRSMRGYVGLQNHDDKSEVKVRNIRITEL